MELEVSWNTLWRIFAVLIFTTAAFFARDAIVALFLAIIISSALDGPVAFLNKKFKIPRILGTASIFAVTLAFIALVLYIIVPVVSLEISSLAILLSGTTAGSIFSDISSVVNTGVSQFSLNTISQFAETVFNGASPVFATIGNIIGGIAFGFSVLVISFYLTLTNDGVGRFLRAVLPEKYENTIIALFYKSKVKVARWLQAQLLLSIVVGVLVSGGLWFLGVKYSLVIGLLAALFEIMPIVGPIFSGTVGTLIALSDSFTLGIYTMILFVAIQQLENHILVPLFMKKVVDIHPVVALFSLLAGYQILGIVGMIISVPIAVVVQTVIEARIERRKLNGGTVKKYESEK
ncbi:MAG: AI-2E family transporter [Candidatus Colwellbacteria bacterium]|nr:AI-2E family transporter [Candidatus Colwellbacteria bacterium]